MRSVPAAEAALHDAERAVMQLQQQQQLRAGVDRSESIARAREALALAAARQQHLRERFREVTHVPRVNFFLQSANDAVVKADTVGGLMDASGRADLQVRVVSCRCRHRPSFLSPPP
jgi:Tfp pilus assembly protein PilX